MKKCPEYIQQIVDTPDDEINAAITRHVYHDHGAYQTAKFTKSRDLCFIFEKPMIEQNGLEWGYYINHLALLEDFVEIEDRFNIICASPKLRARAFVLTYGLIPYKP